MSGGRGGGDVPLTYQGPYDATRTYLPRQVVTSAGSVFMAVAKTAGHAPSASEVSPWLPLGGTPAVPPLGVQSTVGPGLPSFVGRSAGDFHYDDAAFREHVLAGAESSLVADTFSRADTSGTLGVTEDGAATWVLSAAKLQISGNQVVNVDSTSVQATVPTVGSGATTVSAVVTRTAFTSAHQRLMHRNSTASTIDGYHLAVYSDAGGDLVQVLRNGVSKFTVSLFASLAGTTYVDRWTAGMQLTIAVSGLNVLFYVDNILIYTLVEPSAVLTGGFSGIRAQTGAAGIMHFDDFTAFANGTLSWDPIGGTDAVNTVAASGAAQTLPDVNVATLHRITLTANCTFTLPTLAAGKSFTLTLVQDATGSRTATWPASVKWPAGAAPTLTTTAAKADVIKFIADDSTSWRGSVVGLNY